MHHDRRNIISSTKHALSLSVTMYVLDMSFKPISVRVMDNAFINDILLSMTEPNYFVTKPHLVLERWLFFGNPVRYHGYFITPCIRIRIKIVQLAFYYGWLDKWIKTKLIDQSFSWWISFLRQYKKSITLSLKARQQFVCFDDFHSEKKTTVCGVLKGSILGSLLFLLYINDIVNVSNNLYPLSYASDTNTFISGKYIDKLVNIMNVELKKIVTRLNVNQLKLNVKMTQFMLFSSGRKDYQLNNIDIEDINIAHYTKWLGLFMVEDQLSRSHHVCYIKK